MYPVKSGARCTVNLNVPATLGATQDIINIYTRGANMKHTRFATIGYQDNNVYSVFNDKNEDVYLSFYVDNRL